MSHDVPEVATASIADLINYFESLSSDDLEFVKHLAAFLPCHLKPLRNTPYPFAINEPIDVFRNGFADCGYKEWLFQEVLIARGMQCRRVSFAGVPIQIGHSATEVKIDGKWCFFDAAFGLYFSNPQDNTPLSMAKARQIFPKVQVWKTVDTIFVGQPKSGYTFAWQQTHEQEIYDPEDGLLLGFINETYFLSRPFGAEALAYDTIEIPVDLREASHVTLGRNAQGEGSLSQIIETRHGKILPGTLDRLGMFFGGNTRHKFIILCDQPKSVRLVLKVRSGSDLNSIFMHCEPVISPEHSFGYCDLVSKYRKVRTEISQDHTVISADLHILPPYSSLTVCMGWGEVWWPETYIFDVIDDK